MSPYSPEYNSIEHKWSYLKRNIASQIHLYSSVAEGASLFYKASGYISPVR